MKVTGNVHDSRFLTGGFSIWQGAIGCFSTHKQTTMHKTSVEYMAAHYSKLLVTQGKCFDSGVPEIEKSENNACKPSENHIYQVRTQNFRTPWASNRILSLSLAYS